MTWLESHRRAEECAALATFYFQQSDKDAALRELRKAARHEEHAFFEIAPDKNRTRGIIGVSAASLWFKGGILASSEELSLKLLQDENISAHFKEQVRTILQTIWIEYTKIESCTRFSSGQILISLKGGQVITGGAPLELILERFEYIKSMFIRSVEYLKGVRFRRRGPPSKDIQSAFRPWIFQTSPGSYRFSVSIEKPEQSDFFPTGYDPDSVAEFFIDVIRASIDEDRKTLSDLINDSDYQTSFLKMTRNLAPTSANFDEMEIQSINTEKKVSLTRSSRTVISHAIKDSTPSVSITAISGAPSQHQLVGTLRAVHLNEDWLELLTDGGMIRIEGLNDNVDDIIGPMVNKSVSAQALFDGKRFSLIDIERVD